ncbi:MAG: hypothetical protein EAZ55_03195 [Cytophagales bacterium]|nr:MAG: hypothetical protein EAZ55_03195 [Cytophagales bacterium]
MKNIFYSLMLLGLFLGSISEVVAQNKIKQMVAKKWKITQFDFPEANNLSEEQRKVFDTMMKDMYNNSFLDFKKDGSFEIQMSFNGDKQISKGVWEVSDDGKTLTTIESQNDNKSTGVLSIIEISEAKMVLSNEEGGKKVLMTLENF